MPGRKYRRILKVITGGRNYGRRTKEGIAQARRLIEEAIALDQHPRLYVQLVLTTIWIYGMG